jgi:hypothetical protein
MFETNPEGRTGFIGADIWQARFLKSIFMLCLLCKAARISSRKNGDRKYSNSHSQIGNVYDYILNQEKHHAKQTFKDEYLDFLKKFEIEHDVKYLFEWLE